MNTPLQQACAEAFREGVRWRESQDNNGIVSDQYLRVNNPYEEETHE